MFRVFAETLQIRDAGDDDLAFALFDAGRLELAKRPTEGFRTHAEAAGDQALVERQVERAAALSGRAKMQKEIGDALRR